LDRGDAAVRERAIRRFLATLDATLSSREEPAGAEEGRASDAPGAPLAPSVPIAPLDVERRGAEDGATVRSPTAAVTVTVTVAAAAPVTVTAAVTATSSSRLPPMGRAEAIDLRPIATLLARIQEKYHPEQIWLFGSRARGDASPTSDWDLLVVVPDDTQESVIDPRVAWRLQRASGVHADVIPCRASEFRDDRGTVNTISYVVACEGVLIYER
jgi:predicted nucleotidyltransferase